MIGWVHVMTPAEYSEWKAGKRPPKDGPTDGSLAWEGRKLFLKLQCVSCHSPRGRAPLLEGIWGQKVKVKESNGLVHDVEVDGAYIRKSILDPKAQIHLGWEPIMPTFEGQLEDKSLGIGQEEAITRLIAYIKSLGSEQTPSRTEEFPEPIGAPTTVPEGGKKKQ
jgi:cytochrome c oxidase subunit 2